MCFIVLVAVVSTTYLNMILLWDLIFFPPYIISAQYSNGVTPFDFLQSCAYSLKSHWQMKVNND